jgi:hypothetical protein
VAAQAICYLAYIAPFIQIDIRRFFGRIPIQHQALSQFPVGEKNEPVVFNCDIDPVDKRFAVGFIWNCGICFACVADGVYSESYLECVISAFNDALYDSVISCHLCVLLFAQDIYGMAGREIVSLSDNISCLLEWLSLTVERVKRCEGFALLSNSPNSETNIFPSMRS